MIHTEFSAMRASITRAVKLSILLLAVVLVADASAVTIQTPAPVIFFIDLTSGPNSGGESVSGVAGAYVTIYGNNFGAAQGSSTITWNGLTCLRVVSWGQQWQWYQKIVAQLGSSCTPGTGNFVVTVNGQASTSDTSHGDTGAAFTVRSTGNIYCVSTSGNNSNSGKFPNCWSSIPYAVHGGTTVAGDIIYVENGVQQTTQDTYSASVALINSGGGTASMPLALVAYPGATVTVGSSTTNYGFFFPAIGGYSGNNWTIAGITTIGVTAFALNWYDGVRLIANDASCPNGNGSTACVQSDGGTNYRLYGNNIHDAGFSSTIKTYHAIYWSTTGNHTWMGWNTVANVQGCRGIQFYSYTSPDMFDLHVHDNLIHDVRCDGINFSTVNPDAGTVEAYNNVMYNVGKGPDPIDGQSVYTCFDMAAFTTHVAAVKIYNNTCLNAGFSGNSNAGAVNPTVPTSLVNNIFLQLNGVPYVVAGCSNLSSSTNNDFYGSGGAPSCGSGLTGSLSVDPRVVSTSIPNLHLQSGSPIIGIGNAASFPHYDQAGLVRPTPPSAGAYEFTAGLVTLPNPPTNLMVVVN